VLINATALDAALQDTHIPKLRLLSAGRLPPNPAELLGSQAMLRCHEALKAKADMIVFDSPPFLSATDAQVLAAETDGMVYVVQPGRTRRRALSHAVDLMCHGRARLLGLVLNKVADAEQPRHYRYGYDRYAKLSENGNGSRPVTRPRAPALENGASMPGGPHPEPENPVDMEATAVIALSAVRDEIDAMTAADPRPKTKQP